MTITVKVITPDHCAAKVTTTHYQTTTEHKNVMIVPPSTDTAMFHIWEGIDIKIEEITLEEFNEVKNVLVL